MHAVHFFPAWDGSELTWATLVALILGEEICLILAKHYQGPLIVGKGIYESYHRTLILGWTIFAWDPLLKALKTFPVKVLELSIFVPGAILSLLGLFGFAASCSTAPGAAFTYGFLLFFFVLAQIAAVCAFFFFRSQLIPSSPLSSGSFIV